jgi:riboflavin kinase/FMN adenylyltransferase
MKVLEGLDGLREVPKKSVLSIGNFDGIHLGHRRLLEIARELRVTGEADCTVIVTFEPHPLTVLRPALAPPRLTPPSLKTAFLETSGVDYLVVLPPTSEVLNTEAEDFWKIIRDEVQPACMVEGRTFTFGKNRRGTMEKLAAWTAESAVMLRTLPSVSVPLLNLQVVEVSSSLIRWLLAYGRAGDAALCLGQPYVLEGEVVIGHQRGRTIGMPTANLRCEDQLVPADGVYAGRVTLDGKSYATGVSIGTMPTFGENRRQIEAHLIGFDGDLYGRTIRLELLDWLREQQKFADVERLKLQLGRDMAEVAARYGFLTAGDLRGRLRPLHSVDAASANQ